MPYMCARKFRHLSILAPCSIEAHRRPLSDPRGEFTRKSVVWIFRFCIFYAYRLFFKLSKTTLLCRDKFRAFSGCFIGVWTNFERHFSRFCKTYTQDTTKAKNRVTIGCKAVFLVCFVPDLREFWGFSWLMWHFKRSRPFKCHTNVTRKWQNETQKTQNEKSVNRYKITLN